MPLRSVGRILLFVVVIYSAIAAAGAGLLLTRIENEAIVTRERQIPLILSQTRNAVKIERMSSLVRAIFLANDRRLERQLQLQIQALAQGFGFDGSATLTVVALSRWPASRRRSQLRTRKKKNRDEVDQRNGIQSTPGSGKSTADPSRL